MVTSTLTGKLYESDNGSVLYLTNMLQVYRYLKAGAHKYLVDILWTSSKNDQLVFVFQRSELMKELYIKWQNHELG